MATLALATGSVALAQSILLLMWLAPVKLVGDENGYAQVSEDHRLWVRVPLFGILVRRLIRIGQGTPQSARLGNIIAASMAAALAVAGAGMAAGTPAAWIAAAVMLTSVERALISLHLWPESLLSLLFLAAVLLLRVDAAWAGPALAIVVAAAVATRIDMLCLPVAMIALVLSEAGVSQAAASWAVGGAVVSLVAATGWNRWKFGVFSPDSTLGFNLSTLRHDHLLTESSTQTIMQLAVAEKERADRAPTTPVAVSLSQPGTFLNRFARRLATLLGPETFISGRLLDPETNRAGYRPGSIASLRRYGIGFLTVGTPALIILGFALSPAFPDEARMLLIIGVVTTTAVQTRSRYRVIFLPTLAYAVAVGFSQILQGATSLIDLWPGLIAGLALMLFLSRVAPRPEH